MSEFYERKRRLAYTLAVLAVSLLAAGLYLGFFIEAYSGPVVVGDGEGIHVLYRASSSDEDEPLTRLLALDASFDEKASYRLIGDARAVFPEGSDLTAFFGTRYSVLRQGQTVRGADLGQTWPVLAAVPDPATGHPWLFGWSREKKIVGRKRVLGNYSEETPLFDVPALERLTAAADGTRGPLLAWREEGSAKVKCALHDGRGFKPLAEFDIGPARYWDVAFFEGRALIAYYDREDREYSRVSFRLRCCAGCGRPAPPEKVTFEEAVLLIGRQITGLAVRAAADRLFLVVTRPTTLQGASLPLSTLTPVGRPRLVPLGAVPLWRRVGAALFPVTMLFFSFSLVFVGFTLLRERGRSVLEMLRPAADAGPVPAEILQRAMAHIIDLIILFPAFAVIAELLNAVPESAVFDLAEPKWRAFIGTWLAVSFLYHFLLEWLTGRTAGKRIIGIRVVELDGSRLTFRGALLRNLLRAIDAEYPVGVFLGASFMMATARRQRLGDLWGRTLVVQDRVPSERPAAPPRPGQVLHSPRRRL